jgi:SAM-dependent methyltransferase
LGVFGSPPPPPLPPPCARVTAVDHSSVMTARIAERAGAEGLSLNARTMDGQALDLAESSFDMGLSVFGIMMFPDHEAGLRELVRVLVPGGRAGLAVWCSAGGAGPGLLLREAALATFPDRELAPMPLGHRRWREPDRLAADLARAGLGKIAIEKMSEDWSFPSVQWVRDNADILFGIMPIWTEADEEARERLLEHMLGRLEQSERLAVPSPALLATARKL